MFAQTMRVDFRNAALVAGREYLDNVRTRGFWISIALLPLLIAAAAAIPIALTAAEDAAHYAVIDQSGWVNRAVQARILAQDIDAALDVVETTTAPLPPVLAELKARLGADGDRESTIRAWVAAVLQTEGADAAADELPQRLALWWRDDMPAFAEIARVVSTARFQYVDVEATDRGYLNALLENEQLLGYFVIPEDPVAATGDATYVTRKLTSPELKRWYERWITDVIRDRRIREENIDAGVAQWIQAPVAFTSIHLDERGGESEAGLKDTIVQWAPVAFVYLLWISIFAITQMLLTNTVEEKSNKLVEVLLSAIAPIDLMAGKILGIAATGLTIVSTWIVLMGALIIGVPHMLGISLPIDLAALVRNPIYLASFAVYFALGYLFYAAILCAIGSLANNLKEAQNLMMPVQLCLVVPLLVMVPIGRDPNGWLAAALSWFPPFTPFVMMNRAAFPPGWITYAGTTLLMVVSIVVALRIAARVFETGILMTGQPPRLRQLFDLIRGRRHV